MQLTRQLRVLLDRRHELRLHLFKGQLRLLLQIGPDALFVGGVSGQGCNQPPGLIQRHFVKFLLGGADPLHEAVHKHQLRRLGVVQIGVRFHGLGDRLGALEGFGHALRGLPRPYCVPANRRLADGVALALQPLGELVVGVRRVCQLYLELRLEGLREVVYGGVYTTSSAFLFRH